ncbi:MAG: DUF4338 domain-containing protein [Terriglobia bacterium]
MIRNRAPSFLVGRAFTVEEMQDLLETVRVCRGLSWGELVRTVCEHLGWVGPTGRYKVESCGKALLKLEVLGLVKLPLRGAAWGRAPGMVASSRTDPGEEIAGTARDVGPVELEPVQGKEAIGLWNEYVHRYHPLGYKRPFGAHQRYFVVGREGYRLGCMLFAAAAWALGERDRWIGWTERDRAQRLNGVVANTRFIIFPWVRVKNLASQALARAAHRIGADWEQRYGYRPVLLETFVELERYRGTCYQAANWIRVGETRGRGRMDRHKQYLSRPRAIYVYPLVADFRRRLRGEDLGVGRSDGPAKPSGAARRTEGGTETGEAGAETGGPRVARTAGSAGSKESAAGDDLKREE